MGSTRHEKSFVDYDKTYEQNIIGLRGIIYFGVGLFLLIVITFVLMFFLMNVMEDQSVKEKDAMAPMRREALERNPDAFLPPEPRLQVAPGYGVDGMNGRVNLELKEPQSEWWELERKWKNELANGQKDPKTGTVISMPIEEAKNRLIQENIKARPADQGQQALREARAIVSESSAGRLANEKRR
ncbi:MAG: hypothetical protein M3384_04595 [Acidobacteriota bacterium]|nr:hypothetical protein [Acidobacteriota bacterium]